MNYELKWTYLAETSYFEELEFIYYKWNLKEVVKFESLVGKELKRLSVNPLIGKFQFHNVYTLAISKQTTLFFRVKKDFKVLELLIFWNNLKNPEDLQKLL